MRPTETVVDYDKEVASDIPLWITLLDKFFPKLNTNRIDLVGELLPEGETILDIGTGPGILLKKYASQKYRFLGAADMAQDALDSFAQWAKRNKKKHATYHGDFITVDIRKRFDTIVALAYLEHVFSPFHHIQKMSKLLESGGLLFIEVPNVAYIMHRLSLLHGKFPLTARHKGCIPGVVDAHIHFFTPQSMEELLEYCGFRVEMMTCSGRLRLLRDRSQLLWPDMIVQARKIRDCPKLNPIESYSN